ncbi:MAG: hypothetical protein WDM96_08985 [Lacunisphaera sp.]
MSSNESSGASAEATATTPAPSAEFPSFGTTRGSGLARGKRPSAGPAAATASAPSDYKPTAIEVVHAPREYTNPFAPVSPDPVPPAEEAAPAQAETPVVVPASSVDHASSSVAADLSAVTSAQVDVPVPVAEEPAQLNILPPAEQKTAPAQTWESDGFQPARSEHRGERPRREERPRYEAPRDEAAADEPVDIASIPEKFLYVRPGVTFVPTPRNWGGAPRDRGDHSSRPASESAPRREESSSYRSSESRSAAAPAKSGGFLGWLKSLFGGSPSTQPVSAGSPGESHRSEDGGERRHRGGRNRSSRGGEGGGQRRHRGGRNRGRSGGESGGPATT